MCVVEAIGVFSGGHCLIINTFACLVSVVERDGAEEGQERTGPQDQEMEGV